MNGVLAILIGTLYAAGLYMLMRRSTGKIVLGLILLGHAVNLLIFVAGGLTRAKPALIAVGERTPAAGVADPLPQALILTAIVISFGVLAFALALLRRTHQIGAIQRFEHETESTPELIGSSSSAESEAPERVR